MKLVQATAFALAAALGVSQMAGCASQPTSRSSGRFIDDAALTAKVKTALMRERDVTAHDVNVTTYRGVVQLSGFVENENEARRAGEVARNVEGVREVYNDLRVAPAS
jgi:hyperosmotically inducible periplasmic protein